MNDAIRSLARSGNSRRSPRAGRAVRASNALSAGMNSSDDRQLFEDMPVACLLLDRNGAVQQANPAACELLEWSAGKTFPAPAQTGIALADLPAFEHFLQQCFSASSAQTVCCELRWSAGEDAGADSSAARWLRLQARPLARQADDAGRAASIMVVAQAIDTERTTIETLRQQLDVYASLCNRMPGVLFQYRLDPDGRGSFPYVSDYIYSIHGLTPAQMQADGDHLLNRMHPEDLARLKILMDESASSLQAMHHEYRVTLPSGEILWRGLEANPERLADGSVLWHGYAIDISERKHLQETVQQNAERFKLVIEGVGDGVWDWDVTNDTVDFSTRWKTMLGYAEHEISNHPREWYGRVHPDDLPQAEANGQRLLDGVTEHTAIEVRLRARDGGWRWILTRSAVISRAANGRPLRIIGTNLDFTEHRQLEEEVLENEKRWKLALEALEHGFWEWELATNKCVYSTYWKAILGYAEHEIKDDVSEWMGRLHPDDREMIDASFRSLVAREKPSDKLEFRMRCKNGQWKWVMGSGIFVPQGRQGARIVGGMIDISERKRAEETLRSNEERWQFALEGAGDGAWDWDVSSNRIRFSPRSSQVLGFARHDMEHDYTDWCKRVHPEDVARGIQQRQYNNQRGVDASSVEIRVRNGAGQWIWLHSRGMVVKRDEQGNPLRLVGMLRDITTRKIREERMQQLMQEIDTRRLEAEQMAAAKAHFLNAASHDLRQPLYAAQLFTEALDQLQLLPAQQQIADKLSLAINSMSAQLEALLDLSRFDMGKLEAQICEVSLARILEEIEITYGRIASEQNVVLLVRPVNCMVNTDPTLLIRLLGNLVDNAIKFSASGKVMVCVRRSQTGCRIEVRDNGPGIAQEYSQKIFDEYFQIGNPERGASAGMGLGLSIVQRIVRLLGLQLGLRSEPGRGTVFSVHLPATVMSMH